MGERAERAGVMTQVEAGFGNRLEPGTAPALVMVDFVRAYFEPGAQLFMGDETSLRAGAMLLDSAREAAIPVIHTRVSFSADGLDGGVFFKKVAALRGFVGESRLGEFMPPLEPRADEATIVKQYASAFFGTSLASTLRAAGIDTVIIAGVSTSGCIRATAVDAIQHGFVPLVVREAVGDRAAGPHEASLFDIQAKYGEVRSLAEVRAYLGELRRQESR